MELNHLSVYRNDKPATKDQIKNACKTLAVNFCDQTEGFWTQLIEYLIREDVGQRWLEDNVDHLMKHYPYRRLCIFDVLKFDKLIHTLTYTEMDTLIRDKRTDELGLLADGEHQWIVLRDEVKSYGIQTTPFSGLNYSYPQDDAL